MQTTRDRPDDAGLAPRAGFPEPLGRLGQAGLTAPVDAPALTALPDDHSDELEPSPREECGVFGVWAPGEEVSRLTYFGLYALQPLHRVQDPHRRHRR